jgi:hypothetical protein
MNLLEEKILLLKGLENIQKEVGSKDDPNFDALERMLNLVDCLVRLNWKEVGRRSNEKA